MMEVLAGARTDRREDDLRRMLLRFDFLPIDSVVDFAATSRIYRRCRRAGVMPRGMIDCLIAAVAWRRGAALPSADVNLDRIAQVIGIDIDEGSRRS
jgi:predicted nucleic acid-binding protein